MNAQRFYRPAPALRVSAADKKTFDLGIYTFHQIVKGDLCVDESKIQAGTLLGMLHPVQNVDAENIYVFVICKASGQVYQVCRKNLRFKKVITIPYSVDPNEVEVHAKYNAAYKFLTDQTKQGQLL